MSACRLVVVSFLCATAAVAGPRRGVSPSVGAALADPSRSDDDRHRDGDRRSGEVLTFSGIEPGARIAVFLPGDGYYTRILCRIVGPAGRVYAVTIPSEPPPVPIAAACPNVIPIALENQRRPAPELWQASDDPGHVYEYWTFTSAAERFAIPEPLDAIFVADHWHDLHGPAYGSPDPVLVGQALRGALRPGGRLLVEDHAASPGRRAGDPVASHRIPAAQVRAELEAAGFVFDGESRAGRRRDGRTVDPHGTAADRSDRFLLRFRNGSRLQR